MPCRPGKRCGAIPFRSGLGRFGKRPDLAALIVVLTFGAFVNAAGMVAPVLEWRDRLASVPGLRSPLLVTSLSYVLGLVVLPVLMVGIAAALCRWLGRLEMSTLEVATRFSYALVPLGFSMWLAHYSFHFLASFERGHSRAPAVRRRSRLGHPRGAGMGIALAAGLSRTGFPGWRSCALDLGLLLSLYSGYRIALSQSERASQALKMLAPWAVLIVLLFAAGVWIVLQPMQMRGTLSAAG